MASGARHKDAVLRARFGFDLHENWPSGEAPPDLARFRAAGAKPYDIPLPALIAADVEALMMAGRCISGDFIAHSSYRVTGNAVAMGEAAGSAAALAASNKKLPQELQWSDIQTAITKAREKNA